MKSAKKEIYGYTLAGGPITKKFVDYRGYVITDHQRGKITVGRGGWRQFETFTFASIDEAKSAIDLYDKSAQ